jgi:hypothetical protein
MNKRIVILTCALVLFLGCRMGRDPVEDADEETKVDPPATESMTVPEKQASNPEIRTFPSESSVVWKQIFNAASIGPEIKGIEVYGEAWNIKPASISRGSTMELTVAGRISHHIPLALDNQLDYRFSFKDGMIIKSEVSINEREWVPVAEPILGIIARYTKESLSLESLVDAIRKVEEIPLINGWELEGQKLATRIVLDLYGYETSRS